MMVSQFHLQLLGVPQLKRDGEVISLRRRKAMALLAYLVVTQAIHSRDSVAEMLWSEQDRAQARTSLRSVLPVLKKALGSQLLEITRETVQLRPSAGVQVDVNQFHAALKQCRSHGHGLEDVCGQCLEPLTAASALYQGEFMSGFSLPDSDVFDEWQQQQMQILRHEYIDALERLVRCYKQQGKPKQAMAIARKLTEFDPLHEPGYRHLMELLAELGQPAKALSLYEQFAHRLDQELHTTPQLETINLYEQLRNHRLSVAFPRDTVSAPPPNELPVQLTPFIGREEELAEISRRFDRPHCRLLTICGPGGIGKTRLALEVARQHGSLYRHGAFFVPLASTISPDFLVSNIATALKFPFYGQGELQEQLLNYLREKEMFIVMDNFEHLLDGADLLLDILKVAPHIKLLVTSRTALNFQAEWLYEIKGLPYPEPDKLDNFAEFAAVKLFIERAERAQAQFQLNDIDRRDIAHVCKVVEGMPLAVEMAAALVRGRACRQIAQELEKSIHLLATHMRDVPPRHRSMQAVLDGSWKLLSAEEQSVLMKLSLFQGGFSPEAAAYVAGATVDMLLALLDKSLLQQTLAGRYEMHELLQRYLGEKLQYRAVLHTQVSARHCQYFGNLLANPVDLLSKEGFKKAAGEIDNIRAAWQNSVDRQLFTIIRQMTPGFAKLLDLLGQYQEGELTFAQAQQTLYKKTASSQDALIARRSFFCSKLGKLDKARELLQQALDGLDTTDDPETEAYTREMMGHVFRQQGAFQEALESIRKSLALYQQLNDDYGVAKTFAGLGTVLRQQGKFEEAIKYLEQALVLQEKVSDYRGQALTLNDLAGIAYMQIDYETAGAIMSRGSQLLREIGDRYTLVIFLHNQAILASTSTVREYDKAKRFAMESHVLAREMGLQLYMARTLFVLGYLEIETETYDKAIPFFQDSLHYFRVTGANHEAGSVLCGLGEAYFFLGEDELARKSFVEAIEIANEFDILGLILLSAVGIARILNREGKKDKALQYVVTVLTHPGVGPRAKPEAIALLTELTGQDDWQEFVASQGESLAIGVDQIVEEILAAF